MAVHRAAKSQRPGSGVISRLVNPRTAASEQSTMASSRDLAFIAITVPKRLTPHGRHQHTGFALSARARKRLLLRAREPEWLLRGHKLDRHIFHELFHPAAALFHAGLLARNVADHDEGLLASFTCGICGVLHRFPLASFADQEHL